MACDATLLVSEDVSGPVTFGFFEPVVLLPAGFSDMPDAMRDAILFMNWCMCRGAIGCSHWARKLCGRRSGSIPFGVGQPVDRSIGDRAGGVHHAGHRRPPIAVANAARSEHRRQQPRPRHPAPTTAPSTPAQPAPPGRCARATTGCAPHARPPTARPPAHPNHPCHRSPTPCQQPMPRRRRRIRLQRAGSAASRGTSTRPPRTASCHSPASISPATVGHAPEPSVSESTSTNRPGCSAAAARTSPHTALPVNVSPAGVRPATPAVTNTSRDASKRGSPSQACSSSSTRADVSRAASAGSSSGSKFSMRTGASTVPAGSPSVRSATDTRS